MGKNKTTLLTLFLIAIFALTGCDQDSDKQGSGYGTLEVRLAPNNETNEMGSVAGTTRSAKDSITVVTTRASEDVPEVDDFELYMYSNNVLADYWETFSKFDPTTKFAIGNYEMKAIYGKIENEGYYRPYYEGNTKFQIRDREKTDIEITCQLANVKVSIECTDAVKSYFTSFSMQARSSLGKLINITKDETRSIYLKPGTLILSAEFQKQNGKSGELELLRITETEGRQHYIIKVDVNDGNVGSGVLQVTYNTVAAEEVKEIDLSDASLNIKQPVFTTQGFNNGDSKKLREGAQPEAMKVTLNARAGIQTCELYINSPYLRSIGIPEYVDLASQTEEQLKIKQQLADKGLRLIGLNDEIEKLALIDFTPLIMNLICVGEEENETSTFKLMATDIGGRIQEAEVNFSMVMQSNLFAFPGITEKVMIGSTEAAATVRLLPSEGSLSGQTDVENVIFEYQNEDGQWIAAKTKWAGDDMDDKALHYAKIQNLPPVNRKFKIRARYGSKTSINVSELGYYIPDFVLTANPDDIWARKATVKIEANSNAELKAILKYTKLNYNGTEIAQLGENENSFNWTNLNPGTSYKIVAICNNEKEVSYNLSTEIDLQLPNSNFENVLSGPYDQKSIHKGSSWAKRGAGFDWSGYTATKAYESTTMNIKEPSNWVTVNQKTMPSLNDSYANTWFVVPSTDIVTTFNGSSSVRIRNVGWRNTNEELQTLGSVGNFINKDLCYSTFPGYTKLTTPGALNYSAGRLFLGSYSYTHSSDVEIYNEGYPFTSRPSQLKFQYKYISKIEETRDYAYVRIVLKNNEDIIFEDYQELPNTNNSLTKYINFSYPDKCKKATTICIMFCSSKDGTDKESNYTPIEQSKESNKISHYDIGHSNYTTECCVTGSELYIDNIELVY